MHRYHRVLRFNKWHYAVDHLTTRPGGCASYRTIEREKEHAALLVKKWGRDVVRINHDRSVNPRVYVPINGV